VREYVGRGRYERREEGDGKGHSQGSEIESPCASTRRRTDAAKRFKKAENAEAILFKLLTTAQKSFRKLQHPHLLPDVFNAARFKDGIRIPDPEEADSKTKQKTNPEEVAA